MGCEKLAETGCHSGVQGMAAMRDLAAAQRFAAEE